MQINNHEDASALYALALHFLTDEEQNMLKEYMQQHHSSEDKHTELAEEIYPAQTGQDHRTLISESDSFSRLEDEK